MLYFQLRGLLMTLSDAENVIEIRVDEMAQLFNTLDPYPFSQEAEEYIVGWARELPSDRPFRIVIHVPDDVSQAKLAGDLQEAFSRYFAGRSSGVQGDLNELFQIGRKSIVIGTLILIVCLLSTNLAAGYLPESRIGK